MTCRENKQTLLHCRQSGGDAEILRLAEKRHKNIKNFQCELEMNCNGLSVTK